MLLARVAILLLSCGISLAEFWDHSSKKMLEANGFFQLESFLVENNAHEPGNIVALAKKLLVEERPKSFFSIARLFPIHDAINNLLTIAAAKDCSDEILAELESAVNGTTHYQPDGYYDEKIPKTYWNRNLYIAYQHHMKRISPICDQKFKEDFKKRYNGADESTLGDFLRELNVESRRDEIKFQKSSQLIRMNGSGEMSTKEMARFVNNLSSGDPSYRLKKTDQYWRSINQKKRNGVVKNFKSMAKKYLLKPCQTLRKFYGPVMNPFQRYLVVIGHFDDKYWDKNQALFTDQFQDRFHLHRKCQTVINMFKARAVKIMGLALLKEQLI